MSISGHKRSETGLFTFGKNFASEVRPEATVTFSRSRLLCSSMVVIVALALAEVGSAQGRGSRSRPEGQAATGRAVPRGEAGSGGSETRQAPAEAPSAPPQRVAPPRPERGPSRAPDRLPSRMMPEARAVPRAQPRSDSGRDTSRAGRPDGEAPRSERSDWSRSPSYAPNYGGPRNASRYYSPRDYAPRYDSRLYSSRYRYGSPYRYTSRYGAVRPVYRPYYSFRPRTRLSFGIYIGYPVAFPSWYSPSLPGVYANYRPGFAYGGVSFDIYPPDAAIYVDGEYVGIADDFSSVRPPLTLPAGRRHIYIDAYGFAPLSFEITVVPRQVIPYQGSLSR